MSRLLGFLIAIIHMIPATGQTLAVVNPRCEYKQDPIGVDERKPRLSWELISGQQNVMQSAYRILVADDLHLLKKNSGNVWDSKKVISSSSIQVEYRGKELQSTKILLEDNGLG
jgi:hypothetical protein